jgi:hypothetical protein
MSIKRKLSEPRDDDPQLQVAKPLSEEFGCRFGSRPASMGMSLHGKRPMSIRSTPNHETDEPLMQVAICRKNDGYKVVRVQTHIDEHEFA